MPRPLFAAFRHYDRIWRGNQFHYDRLDSGLRPNLVNRMRFARFGRNPCVVLHGVS
jgi:hypothetical protein